MQVNIGPEPKALAVKQTNRLQRLQRWHGRVLVVHCVIAVGYIIKIVITMFSSSTKTKYVPWATSSWKCNNTTDFKDWQICPDEPSKWPRYVDFSYAAWMLLFATTCTSINHFVLYRKAKRYHDEAKDHEPRAKTGNASKKIAIFLHGGIKHEYWTEYAFSAPPITCVVYYYSGVIELRTLIIVFAAQCCLMTIGLGMDVVRSHFYITYTVHYQRAYDVHSRNDNTVLGVNVYAWMLGLLFVIGCLNFGVIWIPVFVSVSENFTELKSNMWFIIALVIGEFMVFAAYAVAQGVFTCRFYNYVLRVPVRRDDTEQSHYFAEEFVDMLYYEHWAHLILSLASKAALAILYVGFI